MLKAGLALPLTLALTAALCGCASPRPLGPPPPNAPSADRVTPPPPPIEVIRPRV